MIADKDKIVNDPISGKIIACAYKVYNTLGFGFLEKVYENSMAVELRKEHIQFQQQHPITVYYENEDVGDYEADLFIENCVVVELKSVQQLIEKHEVQLVHYLKATKKETGLLINFGPDGVEVRRKYKDYVRSTARRHG